MKSGPLKRLFAWIYRATARLAADEAKDDTIIGRSR